MVGSWEVVSGVNEGVMGTRDCAFVCHWYSFWFVFVGTQGWLTWRLHGECYCLIHFLFVFVWTLLIRFKFALPEGTSVQFAACLVIKIDECFTALTIATQSPRPKQHHERCLFTSICKQTSAASLTKHRNGRQTRSLRLYSCTIWCWFDRSR